MGDQFEKFIMENRDGFEDASPSDELWNRIDKGLSKKKKNFQVVWKVAAVLFLVSTIYLIADRREAGMEQPVLSQEFVQAEDFYVSLINERKRQIKEQLSPEQEQQFLKDIDLLDSMYADLKSTYQSNASNERVVDAMINNLQLRVDILNKQLEILEKIKEEENETSTVITI